MAEISPAKTQFEMAINEGKVPKLQLLILALLVLLERHVIVQLS